MASDELVKTDLVFISQVFYPDSSSTSILFSPLLAEIAESESESRIEVFSGRSQGGVFSTKKERWRNLLISRLGLAMNTKRGLLFRGIAYISFLSHVFVRLLCVPKNVKVIAVTNPPFLAWVLWLSSRMKGFNYYYFFLDLHPEGLVSLKSLKPGSKTVRMWTFLNGLSYRAASGLAVLGRDMIPKLLHYKLEPLDFTYIPHWSAFDASSPLQMMDSKFLLSRDLQGKFVVQYSGNMGLWHDITTLIEAAHLLREHSDIVFEFIGGGIREASARVVAEDLNLKNIRWRDFVSEADLAESLAACHVALISLNQGLEGVAVPCKLYGILESGRPVLAQVPAGSEVALTLEEQSAGLVVLPGDARQLAEAILKLRDDPALRERMGANAFKAAKNMYSLTAAKTRFLSWIAD